MFKTKSLIWKIKHPESSVISYIVGTMHLGIESAYTHIETFEDVILSKPNFYGETHLDDLNALQSSGAFNMASGRSLKDYLGEKKHHEWTRRVRNSWDLDLNAYDSLHPFFIHSLLQTEMLEQTRVPLDSHLWQFAKTHNRALDGLESAQRQIDILHQIKYEDQVAFLQEIVFKPGKNYKKTEQLIKLYAQQDIYKLYRMTYDQLGVLRKLLIKERNYLITKKILETLNLGSVYTLGASHLCGKFGVLTLLKQANISLSAANKM